MPEEKQSNGKNSQKTIAIALYILIAVIVIAVGVYWWMTKDEATTTSNNTANTTNNTNNVIEGRQVDYVYEGWQDYKYINEADAMSISMKYPEDWVMASESDEGESFFVDFTSDSNAQAPLEMDANNFWVHATKIVFTGNNATGVVSNNPDYFDEIFAADNGDIIENSLYGDITKIDDYQISGGRPAVIYSVEAISNSDAGPAYNYAVKDGTDIYRIGFMNISAKKASDLNDDKSLFDQMAASFMITDIVAEETDKSSTSSDIEDWNTYTNEEFGYIVEYPTNAEITDETAESVSFIGPIDGGEHWPWLFIGTIDSDFYHPPAGTDVEEWVKDLPRDQVGESREIAGFDAAHFINNASPQAYASDDYYFIKNNQLYHIQLLHAGGNKDWDLYNQFLDSFQFN